MITRYQSFIFLSMKVDKYDRQIRLWGPRGQRRLGQAKVALFGCDGAGIEAIKNLILPGVGTIDIWDDQKIEVEDLSQSFFFQYDAVGKLRAEVAIQNLLQMNPDVMGKHHCCGFSAFLEGGNAKNYNLVIFSGLNDDQASQASKTLWQLNIPCIFVKTVGFFFYVRLQKDIHFVESSNTNSKKYYMRITDPFPELEEHALKHNVYEITDRLEKAENYEAAKEDLRIISNIPYVLLLIQIYRALPQDQRKRQNIIDEIKRLKQKIHEKYRQNWDQALNRILDVYQSPDNFMIDISILDNPQVVNASPQSHSLLRFLNAVGKFFKETGKLPQPTVLPDMHTTTVSYIELKQVYKTQHNRDIEKLSEYIGEGVEPELISEYINNLENLEMVEMTPYAKELQNPDTMMLNYLQNQKDILISLRAYRNSTQSYEDLLGRANELKQKFGINEFDERYLKQFYRGQGKSNINICSMAGAVTGQEAIKLITGCFSPANCGYMFDGALGNGYQVKL